MGATIVKSPPPILKVKVGDYVFLKDYNKDGYGEMHGEPIGHSYMITPSIYVNTDVSYRIKSLKGETQLFIEVNDFVIHIFNDYIDRIDTERK